jgi:hypothetical protein
MEKEDKEGQRQKKGNMEVRGKGDKGKGRRWRDSLKHKQDDNN